MKLKKLSDDQHKILLGWTPDEPSKRSLRTIEDKLESFDLSGAVDGSSDVELPLPSWQKDVHSTVEDALEPYLGLLERLDSFRLYDVPVAPPKLPQRSGWFKFDPLDCLWVACEPLSDQVMILDFETVEVEEGKAWLPTVCCVFSTQGFYIWLADFKKPLVSVIPFGKNNVVIGHNIGYDRTYLASEYLLEPSGNYFFDTMSAHIALRGMGNQQRVPYKMMEAEGDLLPWMTRTAPNGLADCYEFYCDKELDKGVRDEIVTKGLPWVVQNMDKVAFYCLQDIVSTFEVFRAIYPQWVASQPSKVSQVGHLLLGNTWLPLSADRFPGYYDNAESKYLEALGTIQKSLVEVAKSLLEISEENRALDPQLSQLDWTALKSGKNKGLPKWYVGFLKNPSLHGKITPLVIRATYKGLPVTLGEEGLKTTEGNLPHPKERGKGQHDLFVKDYSDLWASGVLDTAEESCKNLVALSVSITNWISLRKRVKAMQVEAPEGFPVTLPSLNPTGTITRRCTDRLWQVATNPKKNRIGTELKSMVEAPKGYRIVGADVASEELWIASALGDSELGICGSTPLGVMVLVGTKGAGTDPHSVLGAKQGIPRDIAKIEVYGGLYGQGYAGTLGLLYNNLPLETEESLKAKANDFLTIFKGKKASGRYFGGLASEAFNVMEAIADRRDSETSVLKAKMPKSLVGLRDFKTTRVNWTIQSLGVDFRDLLILLTDYYYKKLGVEGRLLMTIHDEIRTLVKEGQESLAAYGLNMAHLVTRAIFIDALGLDCIPKGIAYFEEVDVDRVLRKDTKAPQVTPSQPQAIPSGYVISPKDLVDYLR